MPAISIRLLTHEVASDEDYMVAHITMRKEREKKSDRWSAKLLPPSLTPATKHYSFWVRIQSRRSHQVCPISRWYWFIHQDGSRTSWRGWLGVLMEQCWRSRSSHPQRIISKAGLAFGIAMIPCQRKSPITPSERLLNVVYLKLIWWYSQAPFHLHSMLKNPKSSLAVDIFSHVCTSMKGSSKLFSSRLTAYSSVDSSNSGQLDSKLINKVIRTESRHHLDKMDTLSLLISHPQASHTTIDGRNQHLPSRMLEISKANVHLNIRDFCMISGEN